LLKRYKLRNILITGGNGFSGKNLARFFLKKKKNPLLSFNINPIDPSLKSLESVRLNLNKKIDINKSFDAIIHTSGISPNNDQKKNIFEQNINFAKNLTKFCNNKKIKKLIYFSSISIYGKNNEKIINEQSKKINICPYGKSKLIAEDFFLKNLTHTSFVSLRLPGIIGEGSTRNWLSECKRLMEKDAKVKFYNPNSLFNNVIHIRNLSEIISCLLDCKLSEKYIFNVSAKYPMKIKNCLEVLKKKMNSNSLFFSQESSNNSFLINSEKIRRFINTNFFTTRRSIESFA
tara:strand:+ start:148 stop:1014 length:867 start_codon:yes stop_codon:yes gene_type:complete